MNSKIEKAYEAMKTSNSSCAVYQNKIKLYYGRGVGPLLTAYDDGMLRGATVADKVIGKGAAMILAAGGIESIYAEVISAPAKSFLLSRNIDCRYEKECEYIINRRGDGMCPIETAVLEIDDVENGLYVIKKTLAELQKM